MAPPGKGSESQVVMDPQGKPNCLQTTEIWTYSFQLVPNQPSFPGVICIHTLNQLSRGHYESWLLNLWILEAYPRAHPRKKEIRSDTAPLLAVPLLLTHRTKAPENLMSCGTWQPWLTSHQVITPTSFSEDTCQEPPANQVSLKWKMTRPERSWGR